MLTRTHKTLIWERAAVVLRLRAQLLEYFPAAVAAFEDLDAPDTLELLSKAPDPTRAAKLTRAQVAAALKRAGRYKITERTEMILTAPRSPQLGQPPALTAAYAATVRSLIAGIATLNQQVSRLQGQVEAHFGQHPDAEIYLSQPGLGEITGARVLSEFGDDPHRCASGKARRNYAGTSPITRASGKKKIVTARFVRNDRLIDALMIQASPRYGAHPVPAPSTTSNAPKDALTETEYDQLLALHAAGSARFWGATSLHDNRMATLQTGDVVLFTGQNQVRAVSEVGVRF